MHFLNIMLYSALLTIGIIAGIGPQTMNIISHSINKNHAFLVTLLSAFADVTLIIIGCIGIDSIDSPIFLKIIYIIGITFLSYYSISKIVSLFNHKKIHLNQKIISKNKAIVNAIALTWLNPLVFVDTIIVIGGNSSRYQNTEHWAFTVGALIGDIVWLFSVMYVSKKFSKYLNHTIVWRIIDLTTIILVLIVIFKMIGFLL